MQPPAAALIQNAQICNTREHEHDHTPAAGGDSPSSRGAARLTVMPHEAQAASSSCCSGLLNASEQAAAQKEGLGGMEEEREDCEVKTMGLMRG